MLFMNLQYSYKVDLLHSLLVAMEPGFYSNKVIYQYLLPQRTFVSNMNLRYFYVVKLLRHSLVAIVTVFTMATR